MKKLLVLAVLALAPGLLGLGGGQAQAAGTTWYVATTGDDSNDCLSPATPCLTIQAAIAKASSSDTVHLGPGTYSENVAIDRSLTLQGENRQTTVINGSGSGYVVYVAASHTTITGVKVTNGENGVGFPNQAGIHDVTISDVIITSNDAFGILGDISYPAIDANHVIEDCVISNNGAGAFYVHRFQKSSIRNCEVFGNGYGHGAWGQRGLQPASTSDVLISDNTVHDNAGAGIVLDHVSDSIIEKNNVYSNDVGIELVGGWGSDNAIRDNLVQDNGCGICASDTAPHGSASRTYHNELIDNTVQAYDPEGVATWDDGYPNGGNYWSDYAGVDGYSGVNQDEPGSDGIGDTPYVLVNNQDNYPLMAPTAPTPTPTPTPVTPTPPAAVGGIVELQRGPSAPSAQHSGSAAPPYAALASAAAAALALAAGGWYARRRWLR